MLEQYHQPPPPPRACGVHTHDGVDHAAEIIWTPSTAVTRATHANRLDATEWGAYAIAAMTVYALHGWRVVARAHHGSGADLLMMADDDPESFMRLEVSGIAACAEKEWRTLVMARLNNKVDQLGRGDLDYPGVAAVVGFESAHIAVSELQSDFREPLH